MLLFNRTVVIWFGQTREGCWALEARFPVAAGSTAATHAVVARAAVVVEVAVSTAVAASNSWHFAALDR